MSEYDTNNTKKWRPRPAGPRTAAMVLAIPLTIMASVLFGSYKNSGEKAAKVSTNATINAMEQQTLLLYALFKNKANSDSLPPQTKAYLDSLEKKYSINTVEPTQP
jgi:hypothetical protein